MNILQYFRPWLSYYSSKRSDQILSIFEWPFDTGLTVVYGPRREKTCFWGFRSGHALTSLLSYRDLLECYKFVWIKFRLSYLAGIELQRRWPVCAEAQDGLRLFCSQATKSGFSRRDPIMMRHTHRRWLLRHASWLRVSVFVFVLLNNLYPS